MSAVSSRLGYQVLASNPGRSYCYRNTERKKERKKDRQTHKLVYRVAPQLKIGPGGHIEVMTFVICLVNPSKHIDCTLFLQYHNKYKGIFGLVSSKAAFG